MSELLDTGSSYSTRVASKAHKNFHDANITCDNTSQPCNQQNNSHNFFSDLKTILTVVLVPSSHLNTLDTDAMT